MARLVPAVARNRAPILQVLRSQVESLRPDPNTSLHVLEVASGTGEHAAFFASEIPNLIYQPTEPEASMVDSITSWTADLLSGTNNSNSSVLPPLTLTAEQLTDTSNLPPSMQSTFSVDLVICINMIHISPFQSTLDLFHSSQKLLRAGGNVFLYGPFRNEGQEEMCPSNESFDASLKSRNPLWGIRDIGDVKKIAADEGFRFHSSVDMPANNMCVIFEKLGGDS